ncbi:MAG: DEAD/DEAH box helicase [Bacteroidaceae bacterium]|nr:DEAD/DEAH box helicase [Bacteroidaceae bacterium]
MDFYDLDLNDLVLDALDDMNFSETTPIQEHAIPPILEGRDVLGIAQTGTGKTAAYLLPVLSKLQDGGFPSDAVNCIVMSPTRELAQQIDQAMQGFAYYLNVSSVAVYGGNDGVRYEQEKRGMQKGADILIATPGRLISHLSLGNVDLSRVSFFILDEADRMLDMGFSDDILQIEKYLPREHQTIMFSATMPDKILDLARTILRNPVEVKLAVSKPADNITQAAYICYEAQKLKLVQYLFAQQKPERVIIFTGSKIKTKDVAMSLIRAGFNTRAMHSDLSQAERDEVMFQFRSNAIDILVATDIVARGIDIDDIQLVINFDVPRDEEDYVHRIGRTARAGKGGRAITLVSEKDQFYFRQIERFLEHDVEKLEVPAELGDAPEYTGRNGGSKDKQRGRGGKGRGRGGDSHRRRDRKPKGENATCRVEKSTRGSGSSQASQQPQPHVENQPAAEGEKKRKKRHRHHRPKQNPSNESQA